ncbi:trypsin-like [Fopius arisanus]|uniref:Trypsin-like n=1 Tax=Fopius arisanus TaxID=64838 RepID=A0A9R1TXM1_9HYME|nr:PREDICTED: trypsin-like [Fopius arisanus]
MKTNSLCFMILLLVRISHHARSEQIDSSDLPFIVSLWLNGQPHCSGLIYDSNHVITTASCVQGILPGLLLVHAESMVLPSFNETHYSVQFYVTHPSYSQIGMQGKGGSYTRDDIAVITLVQHFPLSARLPPASFKQSRGWLISLLNRRRSYTYFGWIRSVFVSRPPLFLHGSNVTLDRHVEKKNTYYTTILPDIYSCRWQSLVQCQENRGTPIFSETDSKVIGILTDLSFTRNRAVLGTFLKVRKYMTWIQQTVDRNHFLLRGFSGG